MRTVLLLVAGFVLLIVLLLALRSGGRRGAAKVAAGFIVLWLLASVGYYFLSTQSLGDPMSDAIVSALIMFVPPAALAAFVFGRNRNAPIESARR